MRVTCISIAGAVAALLALATCGPEPEPPEVDRAELSTTSGEVVLTYLQEIREREDDAESDSFAISARFVRSFAEDLDSVRYLLGEGLSELNVGLEECARLEPAVARQDELPTGSLEFLDAGDLALRFDEEEVRIPDWSFPSVYGVVAGILYGGDESLGVPYSPEREYRVSSTGSSQIGSFELAFTAPPELAGLTVGASEVGVEPVRIEETAEIRWEPVHDGGEVLAEVVWSHFGAEQRMVCRSRDDGSIELPSSLATSLADPGVADARLGIHRLARESFSADGLDEGQAIFLVTVAVPLIAP